MEYINIIEIKEKENKDKELKELRKKLEEIKKKIKEIEEEYKKRIKEATKEYWEIFVNKLYKEFPDLKPYVKDISYSEYFIKFLLKGNVSFTVFLNYEHYHDYRKPYISVMIKSDKIKDEIRITFNKDATMNEIINTIKEYKIILLDKIK